MEKRDFSKWEPLIAAALVKEFEGLRLEAYLCPAGVPTIGYGHTAGVRLGTRISAEQADQLLTVDLERVRLQLLQSVKVPVSEGQFKALLSFAYNVGVAAVKDSTLLKYLAARPKFQEEVCSQTSFFIVCISRKGVFIGLPRV